MRAVIAFCAVLVCALPVYAEGGPPPLIQNGKASYYADALQGKPTASGELHDQEAYTAASKVLPLGATATVTNLENGRSVSVQINDRGPYLPGRVIDLSRRAAGAIGISRKHGVAQVRVEAHAAEQPTPELQQKVAEIARAREKAAAARTRTAARGSRP